MIVRLTTFSILPDKVDEATHLYNENIVPIVRSQKGNLDCRLLQPFDPSEDHISMTAWDTQEDADAYHNSGVYKEQVEKLKGYFANKPKLMVYRTEGVMEHTL